MHFHAPACFQGFMSFWMALAFFFSFEKGVWYTLPNFNQSGLKALFFNPGPRGPEGMLNGWMLLQFTLVLGVNESHELEIHTGPLFSTIFVRKFLLQKENWGNDFQFKMSQIYNFFNYLQNSRCWQFRRTLCLKPATVAKQKCYTPEI